jgi:hypothetical protein
MPTESWKPAEGTVSLHEDTQEPLEESDFLTETDDLPSPSDIDPDRDFSENE